MATASLPIAARESYIAAQPLPPKGARIWVTGFSRDEHDAVAKQLQQAGFQPTAFATGVDAVLVPDPPTPAILEESERLGRRVLVPDMFTESTQPRRRRTAIDVDEESVRILDITIARRPAGSPGLDPGERFAHLCLDASFLSAARTVAIAADARLPCALEGDTAVAKTTAVLWVAHLCRQEAVRLNLHGQSDTGELVGRFVPADSATVGQSAAAWRFWEGIVPTALRRGQWVVLDELNLAEPQVLERLNPVLEQPPSLVLAEHAGQRFGLGGDVAIADSFRIFATMNPAEYAGRSVLSPAFRDRWSMWSVLEPPGEAEYRALLARLVHGVQPEFVLDGVEWRAPDGQPVYPQLATRPGIDELLDAVASFHGAMVAAAGGDGVTLGRTRRERYVFTRRTMLAAMSLAARIVDRGKDIEAALCEALELVYLQRVQSGPDRQAVRTALRTSGIA